jgi:hypothetical protein
VDVIKLQETLRSGHHQILMNAPCLNGKRSRNFNSDQKNDMKKQFLCLHIVTVWSRFNDLDVRVSIGPGGDL